MGACSHGDEANAIADKRQQRKKVDCPREAGSGGLR